MSTQSTTSPGTFMSSVAHWFYDQGKSLVKSAQEPGTTQKAVRAWIRSCVGITATANYPYAAAVGATVAVAKPDLTKRACTILEGMITGSVKRMSVNQQAVLASVGIGAALYFDPSKIFTVLGTTFALKLGAEYGIRNWHKEERIAAENEAAKKFGGDEIDLQ